MYFLNKINTHKNKETQLVQLIGMSAYHAQLLKERQDPKHVRGRPHLSGFAAKQIISSSDLPKGGIRFGKTLLFCLMAGDLSKLPANDIFFEVLFLEHDMKTDLMMEREVWNKRIMT